jgi:hypothetical protein
LGIHYQGGGLPHACRWTTKAVTREEIQIDVLKSGACVHLRYGLKASGALDMANLPTRIRVNLAQEWTVIFGRPEVPKDGELTTRLASITSVRDEAS